MKEVPKSFNVAKNSVHAHAHTQILESFSALVSMRVFNELTLSTDIIKITERQKFHLCQFDLFGTERNRC